MKDRYGRCVTCGNHAGPECCPRCHEVMARLQTDQVYVIRRVEGRVDAAVKVSSE